MTWLCLCCAGGCEPERPHAGSLDAALEPIDVPPRDRVVPEVAPPSDHGAALDAVSDRGAPIDAPPPLDVGPRSYPPGPYSARIGEVFPPVAVLTCAQNNYLFGETDYAASRATVVLLEPAWCSCTDLERVAEDLWLAYRARGLRVLTVLVEGTSRGDMPSAIDCDAWVSRHGLTHSVTWDSRRQVRTALAGIALPSAAVTDADGRVTYFASGTGLDPAALRAQVAALLGPAM